MSQNASQPRLSAAGCGAKPMASPGKKSFLLRLDPVLWQQLERLAGVELRSVNAQIEYLLREALRRRGAGIDETPPQGHKAKT